MRNRLLITFSVVLLSVIFFSVDRLYYTENDYINGVSFVAPPRPVEEESILPIKNVNATWVAIIPYAFSQEGMPEVTFDYPHQWWGEKVEGVVKTIQFAKNQELKVMLKPHVWVRNQGWAGDFELHSDEDWQRWEKSYEKYILTYAHIADSLDVSMLCLGTEYRKAAIARPEFWRSLAQKVRKIYNGQLTYAANWDNYDKITFWDELDFIGIDAYFPLSSDKSPDVKSLVHNWAEIENNILKTQRRFDLPVLFTEFGYESVDYATDGHWKYRKDTLAINLQLQANAFTALFSNFWDKKSWFAGGFLWKWHANHEKYGGTSCKRYTPQNKPAEEVIRQWYKTGKSRTP